MSETHKRDEIWNAVFDKMIQAESFTVMDIADCTSLSKHDQVIVETIEVIAEFGWLSRERSQIYKWEPGPRFRGDGPVAESQSPPVSISSTQSLSTAETYTGKVDRISGSGNAIVKLPPDIDKRFVNLGPIDSSAVGERVEFKYVGGDWGECLTDEYTYQGYSPKDGISSSKSSSKSSVKREGSKSESSTEQNSTESVKANPFQFKSVTNSRNGLLNNKNTDS